MGFNTLGNFNTIDIRGNDCIVDFSADIQEMVEMSFLIHSGSTHSNLFSIYI